MSLAEEVMKLGESPEEESPESPMSLSTLAAEDFMDAVKSGKAEDVVSALKALLSSLPEDED